MSNIKLCVECNKVKTLEGGFYKAGKSWQKLCKLCHNEKRCEYIHNGSKYIKKATGFNKLPVELQNKIKYDIKVRVNFRDIAEKYKNEGIKYQTLLNWNKKKKISDFEGEILLN
jgi:hypothetical protein